MIRAPRHGSPAHRHAPLLAAAAAVLFEAGYGGASIDAIIACAGGSKRTLYKAFGSKQDLFAAIVTNQVSAALDGLASANLKINEMDATLLAFAGRLMRTRRGRPRSLGRRMLGGDASV